MTEATEIVDDRAARLARLQARRGTSPSVTAPVSSAAGQPTTVPPGSGSLPAPTAASIERTAPIDPLLAPSPMAPTSSTVFASSSPARAPKPPRRRSPATNAKIITIGASTTALLGMMAGYGIADGLTSESPETSAPAEPAAPIVSIPPASPTTTPPAPVTTAPPQVIVVMVDAETGRPISTTTGSGEGVLDAALGSLPGATPVPAPAADNGAAAPSSNAGASAPAEPAAAAPAATPAAPAPVAAPAAVDLAVPAAPQPAPAPQAAPQAAPQPQASSGGS